MKRIAICLILLLPAIVSAALTEGTNCGFVASAPTGDPGGVSNEGLNNYPTAARFTSPAGAVRVTEIGWYCITDVSGADTSVNYEVCLYDNDGSPNNMLSGADRTNALGSGVGWRRVTGLNITISENTIYWIGVQVDSSVSAVNSTRKTDGSYSREYSSGSTLPDPWDGSGAYGYCDAFYAVYDTGAPATSIIPLLRHHRE